MRIVGSASPRLRLHDLAVLAAMVVAAVAPAVAEDGVRAPNPVVERTLEVSGRQVRTTMFSNGMVVVSGRRGSERVFFRQVQLSASEYMGYLMALERDAQELAQADKLPTAGGSGGQGTVTLHVGPKAPMTFSYSSMAVHDLATTRLLATLDDLEYQVIWHEPTGTGIEGWEPQIGDVVKLRSGNRATVVDLGRDGTLTLEHEGTHIHEIVPSGLRKEVIFEVVDDEP